MMKSVRLLESSEYELPMSHAPRRLPVLEFFVRYPIFLLAFGPPEFKSAVVGDTSQAHFDLWNVLQVAWLSAVALRAFFRLVNARTILIPKVTQSILKLPFFLGILFLASVTYSPGRIISLEYCIIYFLNFVCVIEFIVDAYRNPPNWMQCIFQIRLVALILMAAVLLTLLVAPTLVLHGTRLLGGSVAAMSVYPEMIAIISAYTFLYSLESRTRAAFFFLVGLAGTLATQARGAEISLILVLVVAVIGWARVSRHSMYIVVTGLMATILLGGVVVGTIGGDRIWQVFNRGQDTEGIVTASGRTGVWESVIEYSITHPQGMGYISGVRTFHRRDYATNLHASLTNIGGTDNSFLEVLADAGWLALGLYLTMLAKTFALGLRTAKKLKSFSFASDGEVRHSLRCSMLLLMFCMAEGMEGSVFTIPLFGAFYCQNIFIAIILGASASAYLASRPRPSSTFL